jgi:hypothetical protein
MKSVPNLIPYLHEFFQNFSQSLAIYFEIFSSRVNFNSEITDERAPPVRRLTPHRARAAARRFRVASMHCAVARGLKSLSGQRAARPDSPASHPPPDRPTAPARSHGCSLEAASPGRPPCRSPIAVAPRSCPRAGEPPVPRRHPCAGAVAEPHRRRAAKPPHAGRAVPRQHRAHGPCPAWPRVAPALCIWAERGFVPEALKLIFIFF